MAAHYHFAKGDVAAAFAGAAQIVEETFTTGYQEQAYLEPKGMLACWDAGEEKITVYGTMQCPYYVHYIYSNEIPSVFPKALPNAFIYTMNMTEEHVKQFAIREKIAVHEGFASKILQAETKTLYAYNTVQFADYSKYESSIFDPEAKAAYRQEMFPKQCAAAYELGRNIVS